LSHRAGFFAFGALVTAVENSTKPVTTRVTHPGIAIVIQYDPRMP
jgi:hypothetical protein